MSRSSARATWWAGRPVLVTGAAGFIGSHLVEALVHGGAAVRVFVRYSSDRGLGRLVELDSAAAQALEIVYGDLRDAAAVERAAAGRDVVFHLGALISIPYSYENPGAYRGEGDSDDCGRKGKRKGRGTEGDGQEIREQRIERKSVEVLNEERHDCQRRSKRCQEERDNVTNQT